MDAPTAHRTTARKALIAALAIAGAATMLAACSAGGPMSSSSTTGASSPEGKPVISISNFTFSPMRLTVVEGTTVTVVNHDSVTHTLTSQTGAFTTGDIAPGATVHLTAPAHTGLFAYQCNIHQFMTGTLIVVAR
jgi:plastocyanin